MPYPSTVTAFTTRNPGDVIDPAHINAVQTEITALETGLLTTGLQHPLIAAQSLRYSGAITPPALTANTSDYNPAGLATAYLLRLSSDADGRQLSGIAAQPGGTLLVIENVNSSAFTIVLTHGDPASAVGNRIYCPGGTNLALSNGAGATLWYDVVSNIWRVVASTAGAGAGAMVQVPFNAADFGANGSMTWTVIAGNKVNNFYVPLGGKTIAWFFDFANTTIGGTVNTQLTIKPPLPPNVNLLTPYWLQNPSGTLSICNLTAGGAGSLALFRDPSFSPSWTLGSGNVRVSGMIMYLTT